MNESGLPCRAYSDPGIDSEPSPIANMRAFNTTGQLTSENTKEKWEKRKVRFSSSVRVVLIAGKDEYIASRFSKLLWYEEEDYTSFKKSALQEFNELLQSGTYSRREALKELYQPKVSEGSTRYFFKYTYYNHIFHLNFYIAILPFSQNKEESTYESISSQEEIILISKFNIHADSAKKFKDTRTKLALSKQEKTSSSAHTDIVSPLALMCG